MDKKIYLLIALAHCLLALAEDDSRSASDSNWHPHSPSDSVSDSNRDKLVEIEKIWDQVFTEKYSLTPRYILELLKQLNRLLKPFEEEIFKRRKAKVFHLFFLSLVEESRCHKAWFELYDKEINDSNSPNVIKYVRYYRDQLRYICRFKLRDIGPSSYGEDIDETLPPEQLSDALIQKLWEELFTRGLFRMNPSDTISHLRQLDTALESKSDMREKHIAIKKLLVASELDESKCTEAYFESVFDDQILAYKHRLNVQQYLEFYRSEMIDLCKVRFSNIVQTIPADVDKNVTELRDHVLGNDRDYGAEWMEAPSWDELVQGTASFIRCRMDPSEAKAIFKFIGERDADKFELKFRDSVVKICDAVDDKVYAFIDLFVKYSNSRKEGLLVRFYELADSVKERDIMDWFSKVEVCREIKSYGRKLIAETFNLLSEETPSLLNCCGLACNTLFRRKSNAE